jgi:hypothetical protein
VHLAPFAFYWMSGMLQYACIPSLAEFQSCKTFVGCRHSKRQNQLLVSRQLKGRHWSIHNVLAYLPDDLQNPLLPQINPPSLLSEGP